MTLADRLRWAVAPELRRSVALVAGGIGLFSLVTTIAMGLQPPVVVAAFLALLGALAWFVAICGMVGYFRWFFGPTSYSKSPRSAHNED